MRICRPDGSVMVDDELDGVDDALDGVGDTDIWCMGDMGGDVKKAGDGVGAWLRMNGF